MAAMLPLLLLASAARMPVEPVTVLPFGAGDINQTVISGPCTAPYDKPLPCPLTLPLTLARVRGGETGHDGSLPTDRACEAASASGGGLRGASPDPGGTRCERQYERPTRPSIANASANATSDGMLTASQGGQVLSRPRLENRPFMK